MALAAGQSSRSRGQRSTPRSPAADVRGRYSRSLQGNLGPWARLMQSLGDQVDDAIALAERMRELAATPARQRLVQVTLRGS